MQSIYVSVEMLRESKEVQERMKNCKKEKQQNKLLFQRGFDLSGTTKNGSFVSVHAQLCNNSKESVVRGIKVCLFGFVFVFVSILWQSNQSLIVSGHSTFSSAANSVLIPKKLC
uniref:Uncharacterized protein n=1 Tax=Ceratitis capitata TaxID=7213 RepID=W8BW56_CERCA